ncbi:universal stress protein [Kitasatospora sp. NPDC089509]|uniref:universal stress protein n=1 Tax=Kitasatospora sp. NPDC089509 TaxID=3364079 RepID=UPI0038299A15
MSTTITRVVVGVDGSRDSLLALRTAAEEARRHRAELKPVIAYSSPQGEYLDFRFPPEGGMAKLLHDKARDRLITCCARVLGGAPEDLTCSPVAVLGPVGPVLVGMARNAGTLLVIGGGSHGLLHRLTESSVRNYCVRHHQGPVLVVPLPGAVAATDRRGEDHVRTAP